MSQILWSCFSLVFRKRNTTLGILFKDPLVKIQTFVNYLDFLWYYAAGFIIPQSVVLALSISFLGTWLIFHTRDCGMNSSSFIIPDIFQKTDESLDFSERIFLACMWRFLSANQTVQVNAILSAWSGFNINLIKLLLNCMIWVLHDALFSLRALWLDPEKLQEFRFSDNAYYSKQ